MKINLLYDMTRIIQAWNNDNLTRFAIIYLKN